MTCSSWATTKKAGTATALPGDKSATDVNVLAVWIDMLIPHNFKTRELYERRDICGEFQAIIEKDSLQSSKRRSTSFLIYSGSRNGRSVCCFLIAGGALKEYEPQLGKYLRSPPGRTKLM